MTRRNSVRAQAQEIYRERAREEIRVVPKEAPSLTLPRERGREQAAVSGGGEIVEQGLFERALTTTVNDIEHIEATSYTTISVTKVFFQPGVGRGHPRRA